MILGPLGHSPLSIKQMLQVKYPQKYQYNQWIHEKKYIFNLSNSSGSDSLGKSEMRA
jgi:hypothetical protein